MYHSAPVNKLNKTVQSYLFAPLSMTHFDQSLLATSQYSQQALPP